MVRKANKKVKTPRRSERKVLLIATEGNNKTETNYFRSFNNRQSEYRIQMASGNNTDSIKIVEDLIRAARKEDLDYEYGDAAIAIIDTDFGKEKQIEQARILAQKNGVTLLLSNPSFEIWFLLHFKFSTKGYSSNEELLNDLRKEWPQYSKSIQSYSEIEDKEETAIENASKLRDYNLNAGNKCDTLYNNPSTDVYQLIETLLCAE